MGKIFKQLARHWAACLVVIGLLFVQAYCDLSLPDYTSKIVDTGIQQGGIESPLPQTLRSSTRDALSLLMSEEDAETFRNAYGYYIQDDGVLKLRDDLTAEERASLEEIVTMPDIVLYMAASQAANGTGMPAQSMAPLSEYPAASSGAAESTASSESAEDTAAETIAPTAADLDAVCAQFAAMAQMPGFSREMIQQQLASAMAQIDETTLSSMASQASLLVSLEYEAQGVAHDVQMQYLFRVGGQMLGLTLLMVAVAILVGLIASRVSAAIGRDLRRQTFSSVIHFSNAEIENFSTASLITRTTNDIQQVQFVCVILLRMVAYAPILGIGGVLHVVQGNTGLAWIIVLDVILLLCLIVFLMNVAMPKFKIMQTLVDKLNLVSREILTGVMPVRAFSRETFEEERFDKASKELMGTQLFTNRAMVAMMPFMTLIMNGTSLLIVWFGGKEFVAWQDLPGALRLHLPSLEKDLLPQGMDLDADGVFSCAGPAGLKLKKATLSALGLQLKGDLDVSNGRSGLTWGGNVDLAARDLKHSLRQIRGSAPASLPASLNSLRLKGTASGTPDSLRLKDLRCSLGWQQVDGEAAVNWSGTPQLDLRLHAADFDLDRLLAEMFPDQARSKGRSKAPGDPWDLRFMKAFDAQGSLSVDRVRFMRLRMQQMATRFSLKDGHLSVPALEGNFYNSRLRASGDFRFDRGLSYTTKVRALNINLDAASNDRNDKRAVRGLASVESEMSAHLTGSGQMPAALSGTWGVAIINGSYQNRDKAGRPGGKPTRFQRLSASGNMQGGVARSSNIFYQDAEMRVRGGGRIDFNNEDLDCNLFVKTDRMQEFPVRVTGKLHDPKTSVSAGTAILYAVTSLTHGIFELLGGVMEGTWNLFR